MNEGVGRMLDNADSELGSTDPVNDSTVGVANSECCCQATLINDPKAVCTQCYV